MVVKVAVLGDKKLQRALSRLAGGAQKKAVRKGLREAGRPILTEAKRLVPRDSGDLARRLALRALPRSRKRFGVQILVRGDNQTRQTGKAHHVELGTQHRPATPYLRPALDNNRTRARRIFSKTVWNILRKVRA